MADNYSIINGQFFKTGEANILITDLAVQRGYGIFDFFVTVNNQPVFLDDHLDRFYNSASIMRLAPIPNRVELKRSIYELITRNDMPDSGIRITLTGGYSADGYSIATPNLLITQNPFTYNIDSFEKGINLVTYNYQRQLPQVKTIDYLKAIYLQPFIKENKADDVLYHNEGEIRECPRGNFFIVTKDEEVITPTKDILAGVTRKKVLTFSDFNVKEASIKLEDIDNAAEAFVTSTTKFVLPVLSIDGKLIGNGRPGKITTKLFYKLFGIRISNYQVL
jgi:D-alanine transaminase/branched-chain amino acid aminotransferase